MYSWKSKDKEYTRWAHSILGFIPVLALVFWWFVHNGKARQFKKIVRPVQSACQELRGCPSVPDGWQSSDCNRWDRELFPEEERYCASLKANAKTSYYYITNNKNFLMQWHYISSSKLIAEGGTKKSLVIKKYYQGKEEAVIYEEEFLQFSH